jgi:hypothetical protein
MNLTDATLVPNSQSTMILAKKQSTNMEERKGNKSPDPHVAVPPEWERKESIFNSYVMPLRQYDLNWVMTRIL